MSWNGEQRRSTDSGDRDIIKILLDIEHKIAFIENKILSNDERLDRHTIKYEALAVHVDAKFEQVKTLIVGDGVKKGLSERVCIVEDKTKQIVAIWIAIVIFAADILKSAVQHLWNLPNK